MVMKCGKVSVTAHFVDNFSTLAIEDCLISQLPHLLSTDVVASLDGETISEIAMETENAAWERQQTDDRLEMCHLALEQLRSIRTMTVPGKHWETERC